MSLSAHIRAFCKIEKYDYAKIWLRLYSAYHTNKGIDIVAEAKRRGMKAAEYAKQIGVTDELFVMAQAMFPLPQKPEWKEPTRKRKKEPVQGSLFGNPNTKEAI